MTRDTFEELAGKMSEALAEDLKSLMLKAYDALLSDEKQKLDTPDKPYYLVRAIGMAVGYDAVEREFNAELIKPITAKVKRILKQRYWH